MKLFRIISFCSLLLTAAQSHAMMSPSKTKAENDRELAEYALEQAIRALGLGKVKPLFAQECATHVAPEYEAAVKIEARKHCSKDVADKYYPLPDNK
jgi:hypothetical protein